MPALGLTLMGREGWLVNQKRMHRLLAGGSHQLHPCEASLEQPAQEGGPESLILAATDLACQAPRARRDADGHNHGPGDNPRSFRNAFQGFAAANGCPIGADLADLKPPSADR